MEKTFEKMGKRFSLIKKHPLILEKVLFRLKQFIRQETIDVQAIFLLMLDATNHRLIETVTFRLIP
jgi:hypothetical protein